MNADDPNARGTYAGSLTTSNSQIPDQMAVESAERPGVWIKRAEENRARLGRSAMTLRSCCAALGQRPFGDALADLQSDISSDALVGSPGYQEPIAATVESSKEVACGPVECMAIRQCSTGRPAPCSGTPDRLALCDCAWHTCSVRGRHDRADLVKPRSKSFAG